MYFLRPLAPSFLCALIPLSSPTPSLHFYYLPRYLCFRHYFFTSLHLFQLSIVCFLLSVLPLLFNPSLPLLFNPSLPLFFNPSLPLPFLFNPSLPPSLHNLQLHNDNGLTEEALDSCLTIQPFRVLTDHVEMSAPGKMKDKPKSSRSGGGNGSRHKEQMSLKNSVQLNDRHHSMMNLDPMTTADKPPDFTSGIPHKIVPLTNEHHHGEYFSPAHPSPVFSLGPGSPGILPGSPMISSPPHCSPLHLHPPPSSAHFHQAPITVPSTFPLSLPPQPVVANSTDPSSPMQVIYSPSQALFRLQNSTFHPQNGSTHSVHFSSDSHIPGMLIGPSISLQSTTFLPSTPPALHSTQYITGTPSAIHSIRDYPPPPLLTGMQPHIIGGDFSACSAASLLRNHDIQTHQYH